MSAFFVLQHMKNYYTYILYSKTLNKFYIGATRLNPEVRKERHILYYYGDQKFTSKASDWILYLEIECKTFKQALQIENHIKKMKSKAYIMNLKKYPEMPIKLLDKYGA
jgi:putative endonuclease